MFIPSRWLLGLIITLILSGFVGGPLEAASSYFLVNLGYLIPEAPADSSARAINNSGHVVGNSGSSQAPEAFVWNGITMTGLGTLAPDGSGWSVAADINNAGQVVGAAWNGNHSDAFLWNGTTMTGLGDLCPEWRFNCPHYSTATGMNDKVQVVGHASGKTPTEVAFLWDRGIMLAPTYNGLDSYAFDINNSGQFVGASWGRFPGVYGSTPYLWDGTNLIWLPFIELPDDPYPHYHFGSANGINDRGQIVGSDSGYALLWDDGRVVPLGVVGSGLGINNGGQVVGIESSGSYGLGFMWDGSVHSLTDLLDESAVGWTITWAADINDRGQIAATALGPDGLFHAVRLDPTSLLFLDIRPGNEANKINPKSKGRLAVALLSTPAFNVFTQIDQLFLTFGRTGDETSLAFCDFTPMDVNGDGLPDLVCHFYTETTGFQPGDIQGVMKAKTVSGLYMAGSDSVRTVPPK